MGGEHLLSDYSIPDADPVKHPPNANTVPEEAIREVEAWYNRHKDDPAMNPKNPYQAWILSDETGLRKLNILGDGNCLFRCISYLVFGTERYHIFIRILGMQWLLDNQSQTAPGTFLTFKQMAESELHLHEGVSTFHQYVRHMLAVSIISLASLSI